MATDTLDGDINLADSGTDSADLSLRDEVREAYSRAIEGDAPSAEEGPADRKDGRDDRGRFSKTGQNQQALDAQHAAKGGPQTPHPSQGATPQTQQPDPAAQTDQTGIQAPVGWPPEAKAHFANLPPEVQQAIAQREEQVNNGFRVLQNYRGLEQFAPYIEQAGVTYHDVFDRAVKWEQATLSDPVGTVTHLLQLRGLTPQLYFQALQDPKVANAIKINLRQRQGQQPQPQAQPQYLTPDQARALAREEFQRASSEQKIDNDVSAFLADPAHPHAAAIVDDMVMLINAGRAETLKEAYQTALRMHPELAQPINRPGQSQSQQRQDAVSKARAAAKAVTGAPGGAQVTPAKASNPNESLRQTLNRAYNKARGVDDED